jgi:hypothetical protein
VASPLVRRFFSKVLDSLGPAGHDVLTVLGAHEGEGLVLEAGPTGVTKDRSRFADKGQMADAKIVEVALFFQREMQRAAAASAGAGTSTAAAAAAAGAGGGPEEEEEAELRVCLLTADNAQLALARANGLPACRIAAPALSAGVAALPVGAALTAGRMARWLDEAGARAGLNRGAGAGGVPLQERYDAAVSLLTCALAALGTMDSAMGKVREAAAAGTTAGGGEALQERRTLLKISALLDKCTADLASVPGLEDWSNAAVAGVSASGIGPEGGQSGGGGKTPLSAFLAGAQAQLKELEARVERLEAPAALLDRLGKR